MNSFDAELSAYGLGLLKAESLKTVQLNLGLKCNLSCAHCHLEAGPLRTELMSWATMETILLKTDGLGSLSFDLTGGSPELNPHIRRLVEELKARGHSVNVRTNLVALEEPQAKGLAEFFAEREVSLTASLPCYLRENVEAQRGAGSYDGAVSVIRRLNALGYGVEEKLSLALVYNPGGPFLPPPQHALEQAYRKELFERFGIRFTRLLAITNMPLGRFAKEIAQTGKHDLYLDLLKTSFNPSTVAGLMCRHQINVGWDGSLSDCDFNRALGLYTGFSAPGTVDDANFLSLADRRIVTGDHCFGCTAGAGSSCSGSLSASGEKGLAQG